MLRAAFVPMTWLKAEISAEALRTLIAISFFADRSTGECWPSNRQLVDMLDRCERSIQGDIAEIQNAGLISIEGGSGKNRKFRIESEDWFQKKASKSPANPAGSCGVEDRTTRQEVAGLNETTPQEVAGLNETTPQDLSHNPAGSFAQPRNILRGANKNVSKNTSKNSRRERWSFTEESKPGRFAEEISLSLSDLSQKPEPIPPKLKRMATDLGAESWLGEIQFQEIPFDDWRIEETLIRLKARGGNKGSSYIWKIFRDLPEKRPNVVNGYQAKPKPPPGLLGAEAGLAMAKRMISTGEATQDDVDRYQRKVEDIKRKAGIQ